MKVNTYLYKNKKLEKKYLNINGRYDKNMHRLEFNEEKNNIQVTFDENRILYERNNNNYIFKLKYEENSCLSTIEMMKKKFIINVLKCIYRQENNKIYLSYIIETDIENENQIIIEILDN